ncbi:MAG: NAD(P)/FAD-dependent oxidoreductase [Planctomycetaceae bacterium]
MIRSLLRKRKPHRHDVIVVGAGAAGVGIGVALMHAGVEDFLIVDRHDVGASFERWPREMKFITPSFPTNSIGMLDLNSVAIGTSPAYSLKVEHPTGPQFAHHLKEVAEHFELPVHPGIDVLSVARDDEGFAIQTNEGTLLAKHVVWAAGEFQYPRLAAFPGAELCLHNATVSSWQQIPDGPVIVIGGYESGIDAAIHLARLGHAVTVLDKHSPWESDASDPSVSLSTFTHERLAFVKSKSDLNLEGGVTVRKVVRNGDQYEVHAKGRKKFDSPHPPILATGFEGSVKLLADLFETREDGYPLLSERDESTITPGLFLCGPMVRHDNHVFCFIYKFRQRFAVVAKAIATQLGLEAEELENYRQWGMYLDDLSCCGEECVC